MKNIEQYRALTQQRNWVEIFKLNGLDPDTFGLDPDAFGTEEEIGVLGDYLQKDEIVFALVSGRVSQRMMSKQYHVGLRTRVVALTNERILFLDHAMFSSSVDTQSIRLDHIHAVSDSQGWWHGTVTIDISSRIFLIVGCEKEHVKIFADMANQLIQNKEDERDTTLSKGISVADEIEKLSDLHKKRILTDKEFSEAKAKLISDL